MIEPIFNYDEESDTLSISFALGERGTGIELTEHILLRLNKLERRAVGITLLDYSILVEPTELGPRNFRLVGLENTPSEVRDLVLDILRHSPVQEILALSAYTPTPSETTPIIAVQPIPLAANTI